MRCRMRSIRAFARQGVTPLRWLHLIRRVPRHLLLKEKAIRPLPPKSSFSFFGCYLFDYDYDCDYEYEYEYDYDYDYDYNYNALRIDAVHCKLMRCIAN